ncbi:MAG: carbon storage regulator CsrA [Ignavibacteriaceae bacterium]
MLILTRKIDEDIKIGSGITIKVLSISEGQVKLGISAPENVEIFRGEIYKKVKQVTIEASQNSIYKPKDLSKLQINNIRKLNNES